MAKPKLTSDGRYNVYRSKTLRVTCSEDQAKAIITPIVDFTAYMPAVDRVMEMPQMASITASMVSCKLQIAKLLALELQTPIEPITISEVNVDHIQNGSYFKIKFRVKTESVVSGVPGSVRPYAMTLSTANGTLLVHKLRVIYDRDNPGGSVEGFVAWYQKFMAVL